MELMSPDPGALFWTIVTFICLLLILRKVAWKPILQTLDEREKIIQDSLNEAEKARREAQKTLNEQSEILEKARKQALEMIEKSRKTAETAKEEIISKAGAEAQQMLERAKREIELSRDKAIEEIKDLSVELSMAATAKLIGKSLNEKEHKAIIQESIKKLGDLN